MPAGTNRNCRYRRAVQVRRPDRWLFLRVADRCIRSSSSLLSIVFMPFQKLRFSINRNYVSPHLRAGKFSTANSMPILLISVNSVAAQYPKTTSQPAVPQTKTPDQAMPAQGKAAYFPSFCAPFPRRPAWSQISVVRA